MMYYVFSLFLIYEGNVFPPQRGGETLTGSVREQSSSEERSGE